VAQGIDLGHNHHLRSVVDKTGTVIGYTIEHPHKQTGGFCDGLVTLDTAPAEFRQGNDVWSQPSVDPLTLEPSVLCHTCGDHGFVRAGKWEPA
jgi:hypothetical protein